MASGRALQLLSLVGLALGKGIEWGEEGGEGEPWYFDAEAAISSTPEPKDACREPRNLPQQVPTFPSCQSADITYEDGLVSSSWPGSGSPTRTPPCWPTWRT